MTFDDADEKMTRDEIEYMLTNSEETLDADEIEMLQGIFSLDELMAREVMVPRTDALWWIFRMIVKPLSKVF